MPINDLITLRKGTFTQWFNTNPVLNSGEPGFDITNNIFKIGDGINTWGSLPTTASSDIYVYVKNTTSQLLTKGQVVYINGAQGNHPTIALAVASGEPTSSKTLGLLKQDLDINEFGYVVSEGILDEVDTNSSVAAGDTMWLSPTTPGGIVYGSSNKPSAPNHMVFLGYVLRKQLNNGIMYIKVQNGYELEELHNVSINGVTDGQFLQYNSNSGLWLASNSGNFTSLLLNGTGVSINGHTHTSSSITDFNSSVSGLLSVKNISPGSGISVNVIDGNYTINSTSSGGGSGSVDVYEYQTTVNFPASGTSSVIYIATDSGKTYRWTGSVYVEIGSVGGDLLLWNYFKPTAPSGVSATAGNAQVVLSWSAPTVLSQTPITDYIIQYSSNSGSTWTTFNDGTSITTNVTVTGLTNNTSYIFRVAAVNGIGQGEWSTASSSVTPQEGDPLYGKVSLLLHMDGSGTTFTDSSKYVSTVTAYGSATQSTTQSKFGGKSLELDGSSARLTVPGSVLSFTSDFVLEAWVYPTTLGVYAPIMEGRTSASYQNWICGLYNIGGAYKLDFVTDGGGSARLTSSSSVPLNQWSHIVFVRSSSTLACYINGIRDANTVSYGGTIAPADSVVTIGKNVDGNYFTGYIDELRVTRGSNRSFTGATITVPTNPFPEAAYGYDTWFDEVSLLLHLDGNLTDSGPLGNTVSANNFVTSTAQVKFGSGSYLNSTTSAYIYTNTTPALGTGDYTMEGWFYPTGEGSYEYHTLFDTRGIGDSASGKNFGIRTTTGRLYADGIGDIFGAGGPNVTLNQWNHIAFCRSAGTLRGYVNGVQQGSSVSSTVNHTAGQTTIASNSFTPLGAEPFRGYVDEVRVTRVARYKQASFTVPTEAFSNS